MVGLEGSRRGGSDLFEEESSSRAGETMLYPVIIDSVSERSYGKWQSVHMPHIEQTSLFPRPFVTLPHAEVRILDRH